MGSSSIVRKNKSKVKEKEIGKKKKGKQNKVKLKRKKVEEEEEGEGEEILDEKENEVNFNSMNVDGFKNNIEYSDEDEKMKLKNLLDCFIHYKYNNEMLPSLSSSFSSISSTDDSDDDDDDENNNNNNNNNNNYNKLQINSDQNNYNTMSNHQQDISLPATLPAYQPIFSN